MAARTQIAGHKQQSSQVTEKPVIYKKCAILVNCFHQLMCLPKYWLIIDDLPWVARLELKLWSFSTLCVLVTSEFPSSLSLSVLASPKCEKHVFQ